MLIALNTTLIFIVNKAINDIASANAINTLPKIPIKIPITSVSSDDVAMFIGNNVIL